MISSRGVTLGWEGLEGGFLDYSTILRVGIELSPWPSPDSLERAGSGQTLNFFWLSTVFINWAFLSVIIGEEVSSSSDSWDYRRLKRGGLSFLLIVDLS